MICGLWRWCAVPLLQVILTTIRDDIMLYSTAPGINARARVGAGAALSHFFALCGAADGVLLCGSVSGYSFSNRKAWRGVYVVFYISGGKVKNLHGHKNSTAGAVLVPSWRCWRCWGCRGSLRPTPDMASCLLPAPCGARPWLILYDLAIDAAGQAPAYDARAVAP